jgi:hypothetical protein
MSRWSILIYRDPWQAGKLQSFQESFTKLTIAPLH